MDWTGLCRVREGEQVNTQGIKKRADTQQGLAYLEELETTVMGFAFPSCFPSGCNPSSREPNDN